MAKPIVLGQTQTFDGVTLKQEPSGGWRVEWGVTWHFAEMMDALERVGVLMAAMRATSYYRVKIDITPERMEPRKRATKPTPATSATDNAEGSPVTPQTVPSSPPWPVGEGR